MYFWPSYYSTYFCPSQYSTYFCQSYYSTTVQATTARTSAQVTTARTSAQVTTAHTSAKVTTVRISAQVTTARMLKFHVFWHDTSSRQLHIYRRAMVKQDIQHQGTKILRNFGRHKSSARPLSEPQISQKPGRRLKGLQHSLFAPSNQHAASKIFHRL